MNELPSEISIQCLLSAGRLESFTKAAEELFMTRQAVSRQIAHLEKELGAQLFQRNTAKVELTAVGVFLSDPGGVGGDPTKSRSDPQRSGQPGPHWL